MPAGLIPALVAGGTAAGSLLAGRRTKEEKAATEASARAMNTLERLSGKFADISLPALEAGSDFWRTLAGLGPSASTRPIGATGASMLDDLSIGRLPTGRSTPGKLANVGSYGITGRIGAGRREANRFTPTQEALDREFAKWSNFIKGKQEAGTITPQDYRAAAEALMPLREEFTASVQGAKRAGPGALRETAWQDVQLGDWTRAAGEAGATAGDGDGASAVLRSGTPQRQAIERLLSVPIQQLSMQYETAKRNIMDTMAPGGAREQALANLEQSRTATLSNLFVQAPQIAAEQLTNLGMGVAPMSTSALGNLLWGGAQQQLAGAQRAQTGTQLGIGIGSILGQLLWGQQNEKQPKTRDIGVVHL